MRLVPRMTRRSLVRLAYLLGSIPFSYLVARRRGVGRAHAWAAATSGPPTSCAARARRAGLAAFVLDFAKGAAGDRWSRYDSSAAPAARGGRGGRGARATCTRCGSGSGAARAWPRARARSCPLAPLPTVARSCRFAVVALATRYVSLGSIVGRPCSAVLAFLLGALPPIAWAAAAARRRSSSWKHRENIRRLASGTESRMGAEAARRRREDRGARRRVVGHRPRRAPGARRPRRPRCGRATPRLRGRDHERRENPAYLPGRDAPAAIAATTDLADAVARRRERSWWWSPPSSAAAIYRAARAAALPADASWCRPPRGSSSRR